MSTEAKYATLISFSFYPTAAAHLPAGRRAEAAGTRLRANAYRGVVKVDPCCARAVVLHERPDEAQPEGPLEQELGLPLVLGQAEEGHVPEVLLGRLQEELGPLLLRHRGHVVAAHQAQVGQHAHLQAGRRRREGERGGGRLESQGLGSLLTNERAESQLQHYCQRTTTVSYFYYL